jgi:hypothetical protein
MRSDAQKAIRSLTSATAELLSTRERKHHRRDRARRVAQTGRPQSWHISRNSKVAHEAQKVRRHVHPTKTRKDTPATYHSFEPLIIARPAAALRLA